MTDGNNKANAYFSALGTRDQKKLKAALVRAHEIRQFEIDLYWKRATYFWLLQAAVFTAVGFSSHDTDSAAGGVVAVALSCLGILTSLSGLLTAQGSKFWQSNWELHIDMLEDQFEGKLHKTIWIGPLGVRWSVSGINDRLSFFFVVFWVFLTIMSVAHACHDGPIRWRVTLVELDYNRTIMLAIILASAVGTGSLLGRISDLRGELRATNDAEPNQRIQRFPHFSKKPGQKYSVLKRASRL